MKKIFLKKQKGFMMVELVIAVAVFSFGILGTYWAFAPLILSFGNNAQKLVAVYLAQEAMEITRNIRDFNFVNSKNWTDGLLGCELGCQLDYKTGTLSASHENQMREYNSFEFLNLNEDGFYSYDQGVKSPFKRKITIVPESGSNALKVNVQVFWNYSSKDYEFETTGYLYNWW